MVICFVDQVELLGAKLEGEDVGREESVTIPAFSETGRP